MFVMENNSANPTQQPLPVSQTPHRFSKTFIILIVILLVVAVGVGGYILGVSQNQTVQNQPVTQISQPSPTPVDETANTGIYKNTKDGFSIEYPPEWYFGISKYGFACLASDQIYIDFYCYEKSVGNLIPEIGFKTTNLGVDSLIVPENTPEKEALKLEHGRGALPLISEQYLTINGIPSYRAVRQIKKGQSGMGMGPGSIFEITSTDVEYTYLKKNKLYRLWFEIDNNEPDEYISVFDQVARTFKLL